MTTVVERTEIERRDGEIKYKDDNGEWVAVGENTPVSMNVWGFTPEDVTLDGYEHLGKLSMTVAV